MRRRRFIVTALSLLPLATLRLRADDQGKSKGKGNSKGKGKGGDDDHYTHYFREQDYGSVERYYSGPRDLPPGLRKKYYRTGTLPPGWEKRFQPFPLELAGRLPPLPPNCERGYID